MREYLDSHLEIFLGDWKVSVNFACNGDADYPCSSLYEYRDLMVRIVSRVIIVQTFLVRKRGELPKYREDQQRSSARMTKYNSIVHFITNHKFIVSWTFYA